jgi:hypothetical protein
VSLVKIVSSRVCKKLLLKKHLSTMCSAGLRGLLIVGKIGTYCDGRWWRKREREREERGVEREERERKERRERGVEREERERKERREKGVEREREREGE